MDKEELRQIIREVARVEIYKIVPDLMREVLEEQVRKVIGGRLNEAKTIAKPVAKKPIPTRKPTASASNLFSDNKFSMEKLRSLVGPSREDLQQHYDIPEVEEMPIPTVVAPAAPGQIARVEDIGLTVPVPDKFIRALTKNSTAILERVNELRGQ